MNSRVLVVSHLTAPVLSGTGISNHESRWHELHHVGELACVDNGASGRMPSAALNEGPGGLVLNPPHARSAQDSIGGEQS